MFCSSCNPSSRTHTRPPVQPEKTFRERFEDECRRIAKEVIIVLAIAIFVYIALCAIPPLLLGSAFALAAFSVSNSVAATAVAGIGGVVLGIGLCFTKYPECLFS